VVVVLLLLLFLYFKIGKEKELKKNDLRENYPLALEEVVEVVQNCNLIQYRMKNHQSFLLHLMMLLNFLLIECSQMFFFFFFFKRK
jgi:hypothetical protein